MARCRAMCVLFGEVSIDCFTASGTKRVVQLKGIHCSESTLFQMATNWFRFVAALLQMVTRGRACTKLMMRTCKVVETIAEA